MIELPSSTTILEQSGNFAMPFFSEFLWIVYFAVGAMVVVAMINFMVNIFGMMSDKLAKLGHKRNYDHGEDSEDDYYWSRALYERSKRK